jgi:hypothetical protein
MAATLNYHQQVLDELESIPEEYFPFLLQMIRSYRESVLLKPAAASFRQGGKRRRAARRSP